MSNKLSIQIKSKLHSFSIQHNSQCDKMNVSIISNHFCSCCSYVWMLLVSDTDRVGAGGDGAGGGGGGEVAAAQGVAGEAVARTGCAVARARSGEARACGLDLHQ